MDELLGFISPLLVYCIIFALNAALPGRWVTGYVTGKNTNEKLKYRLNGIPVLGAVLFAWVVLCYTGLMPWDWFYMYRWYALAGAILPGLIFSFAIVLPFPAIKDSFGADFFLGRLENPQLGGGRIDAKIWLYLVGAIMLELNILSFAAHHCLVFGEHSSPGIFLGSALLTFFVVDYLTFEEVHLYTYDFFAEKVGFKLGFGCIAFYPFFYSVPLWFTVDLPSSHTPAWLLVIFGIVFFSGWTLSRGANMQKYFFKKDPKQSFLGIVPASITDGDNILLVNGFWGLSRHINYLGEILMAIGIVLCTGPEIIWPWLYPLYYIALLFPRQHADNRRCAKKYGELWNQYIRKVPYKIIPFVY